MLPINKGEIIFDKTSVQKNNIKIWQKKLGYVPQKIFLTDDTIKNNIAFAIPEDKIDDQKIVNAAKLAELDEYISSLPNKYNSIIIKYFCMYMYIYMRIIL